MARTITDGFRCSVCHKPFRGSDKQRMKQQAEACGKSHNPPGKRLTGEEALNYHLRTPLARRV